MDSASGLNSEWAQVVTEIESAKTDTVPPGWKTAAELIGVLAHSRQMVQDYLKKAVTRNPPAVEVRKFVIQTGQRVYPVPHYRLLKPRHARRTN